MHTSRIHESEKNSSKAISVFVCVCVTFMHHVIGLQKVQSGVIAHALVLCSGVSSVCAQHRKEVHNHPTT